MKVVRCKHLKLLKDCVPCGYGIAIGERLDRLLMTEHERRKGGRVLRSLLAYRAGILEKTRDLAQRDRPKALRLRRGMLAIVVERRFSYEDLVLAYRVLVLKRGLLSLADTADRMRVVLVAKFFPN